MLMLNACNKKTENLEEPITTSLKETKKVEIFRLSSDIPNLSFETNGTIEAKNKATITNEITGKLKEINVKVGDKVEENQVLFQLGDSLNTDTIKTQHEIALKNLELTNKSASLNLENAYNNADLAKISYENSISNKYDVIRNYETQLESLYHQIDQAEENYEDAKDYYKDNKEDFDEVSKKAAKQAKYNAKFQLEQLEMSLGTFNANYFTQVDQVEFSIDSAKNQYQSSITQTEII